MANFSTNLQYRRMAGGMTQEQLAERMGVSRQTVSKWESGASYPEMEKLIALCGLFDCTLDELVRGGLPAAAQQQPEPAVASPQPEALRADYERVMGGTARGIAVGVALIVSGGHTSLLHVEDMPRKIDVVGTTLDDAAGECFDKVARLLGFPYPGGPHIDRHGQNGDPHAIKVPMGLTQGKAGAAHPYDFSFSGVKTAVARWVESEPRRS